MLQPSGGVTLPDGGAGLTVDDAEKQAEVAPLPARLSALGPTRGARRRRSRRRARAAIPSAVRSARSPVARRTTATPVASSVTQARLPSATPATSGPAPEPSAAPATLAAAKIAAQEAIVLGYDAVAASEVRNARCGRATSDGTSSPCARGRR